MGKLLLLVLLLAFPLLVACSRPVLTLATTTSTYDSGLLDVLAPLFEKEQRVQVKVIAVGSGQSLELGKRGDADVILAHSPEAEEQFMTEGHGAERRIVMYNDFVLVGPPGDPAGIKGLKDAPQALSQIAQHKMAFASRGDDSGTYNKELSLWQLAGLDPKGQQWYFSLGQGMGETLTFASEKGAYTLSDRGTYLARRAGLNLALLVEGDQRLFNMYHVIVVNPKLHPKIKYELAQRFAAFITSPETQRLIGQFGMDKYGQPLFVLAASPGK